MEHRHTDALRLNGGRTQIDATFPIDLQGAQCRIDLEISPDGALFTTVGAEGGAIYRLVPGE
ncbi:MAG: hypothetical protein U0694_24070 [Anaerolineae bacterium]